MVVLLLGLLAILWVMSPTEQRRRRTVEDLAPGDSTTRLVEALGRPGATCPGGSLAHLERSFPQGWPVASIQTAIQELGQETAERWVYPVNPRREAGCAPRTGQTEVGVDRQGRILWYVAVVGKTPLELPESYAPANPEGSPAS